MRRVARRTGINVEVRAERFGSLLPNARAIEGVAERSNRKWVEELIEKDVANPPRVVSEEVFVFGADHAG